MTVAAPRSVSTDESVSQASDRALARRAGLGDGEAFEELFGRRFLPTLRYALRMLDGDEQLAEEAVQETWIKAWRGLPDYRGDSAVQTWLFSIVAHEVLTVRRRRRPVPVDSTLLDPLPAKPSTSVDP
ncbi:MAG: sigma factor, partial [Nocardioidaceae bacterium]